MPCDWISQAVLSFLTHYLPDLLCWCYCDWMSQVVLSFLTHFLSNLLCWCYCDWISHVVLSFLTHYLSNFLCWCYCDWMSQVVLSFLTHFLSNLLCWCYCDWISHVVLSFLNSLSFKFSLLVLSRNSSILSTKFENRAQCLELLVHSFCFSLCCFVLVVLCSGKAAGMWPSFEGAYK